MIFFNEKKIQKDSDDFWHRKLTLKVKFWYFLTAPHYSNFQNLVISFEYSWFLAKNLSNFLSLPWKLHNRECHSTQIFTLVLVIVQSELLTLGIFCKYGHFVRQRGDRGKPRYISHPWNKQTRFLLKAFSVMLYYYVRGNILDL